MASELLNFGFIRLRVLGQHFPHLPDFDQGVCQNIIQANFIKNLYNLSRENVSLTDYAGQALHLCMDLHNEGKDLVQYHDRNLNIFVGVYVE